MFTRPGYETCHARAALRSTHERSGEFLLGKAFGCFLLRAVIDDNVAHGTSAFDARDVWFFVGIDIFNLDL